MTNSERYRAAFGHLRAPSDAAQRAAGALEHPTGLRRKGRRHMKPLIAAAAILLVLAGAVGAEASSGEISNLLAPLYGGSQTALVDHIGVPLDATVTDNGYTLTAEAVLGDRYHFMVVYTLTREDGEPIPEGVTIQNWEGQHFGSGGGSLELFREGLPENQLRMIESWSGSVPLLGRYYTVTFQNLVRYGGEDHETEELLGEGTWTLSFALRFRDCTVKVPLNGTTVTDQNGGVHTLRQLFISPIGFRVELTSPVPDLSPGVYPEGVKMVLRLTDGTLIRLSGGSGSGSWVKGDAYYDAHMWAGLAPPIPLEDMEAIIFNDVEIPLNLS